MPILETNKIFKTQLSSKAKRLTQEEIDAVKNITLEIACDVAAVCEENKIPYMLGGGSALGAVRHHGFIPWDDDLDFNVPRRYIDPLLDEMQRRYGDKYYIEAPLRTEGYLSSFVQIHKNGTIFREFQAQREDRCGVKVDIFPIENTYDNPVKRKLHGILSELGLLILSCYRMYAWREEFLALADGNTKARLVFRMKGFLGMLAAPAHRFWYEKIQKCMMHCKDENSGYVVVPSGRKHFFGELYRRESFLKTVPMKFEDRMFPVTGDYDHYLKNLYGDYRKLPPEEQREHHVVYKLKL